MATPLRAVHSSLSSSSRVGIRLRRNATATASRRAQLWVPSSCSTSETRPIVSAASCSISDGLMLSTAERRPTRATGRGNTQTPRAALRLFSAVAPLFEDTIIVTKRCAERLNELRISKGQPELRLRLTVEGGGCSGFQYRFALEDAASGGGGAAAREAEDEEDSDDEDDADVDHKFERDGAVLIVDDTSLGFVKGATVDFEEDMMRSAFAVLNNPVSESACGCGSSFAIKNFEKNPALD